MQTLEGLTRKYFITSDLESELPHDFVNSPNQKYIIVDDCKLFISEPAIDDDIEAFHTPRFVTLHADFIHNTRYLDSYVGFCNSHLHKEYQQFGRQNKFKIWFKDINANPISMTNVKFILELLLIY